MDSQPTLLRDPSATAPVGLERPVVAGRRRRRRGREPLDAARPRRRRHGHDCGTAIRLDALHRIAHPGPRHQPGAAAGDVLGADRRADVSLSGPGRAHRALRTARAAVDRDAGHGRELDAGVAGVERVGALSQLWPSRRHRHGIVYIGVVGHMVRWFPDRRGLATGFVAAGYGMGALLFTFPVAESIRAAGHSATLLQFQARSSGSGAFSWPRASGVRRPPCPGRRLRRRCSLSPAPTSRRGRCCARQSSGCSS